MGMKVPVSHTDVLDVEVKTCKRALIL